MDDSFFVSKVLNFGKLTNHYYLVTELYPMSFWDYIRDVSIPLDILKL